MGRRMDGWLAGVIEQQVQSMASFWRNIEGLRGQGVLYPR